MIDLLHAVHRPPHSKTPIRLNAGFRSDLAWWRTFLTRWNGVSFLHPPRCLSKQHLATDASGAWGCGAWHGKCWFQLPWDARTQQRSIAEKELLPIVIACASWGQAWQDHQIICHCDNQAVVASLRSRTSKVKGIMHLLWCLAFIEAHFRCYMEPTYIDTKSNHLADDLSRNNIASFLLQVPQAHPHPTPISPHLLELLLDPRADWTSPRWQLQFSTIFDKA